MPLKQRFHAFIGKTSSKYVYLVKRTRFNGNGFEKHIFIIQPDSEIVRMAYNGLDFVFSLAAHSEVRTEILKLIDMSGDAFGYSANVEKLLYNQGFFVFYKLNHNLHIEMQNPSSCFSNNEISLHDPAAFTQNYDMSIVPYDFQKFWQAEKCKPGMCTNVFLRDILMKEVKIFLIDCLKMMSVQ